MAVPGPCRAWRWQQGGLWTVQMVFEKESAASNLLSAEAIHATCELEAEIRASGAELRSPPAPRKSRSGSQVRLTRGCSPARIFARATGARPAN